MNTAIDLARGKKVPFRVMRGQVIDYTIFVKNPDGTDYDFTGHTGEMPVYNSFSKTDTPEYNITITLAPGSITFSHSAITRKREEHVYQLWITDNLGYRQVWLNGPFLILNSEVNHFDDEEVTFSVGEQAGISFQEEGSALGTRGTVTELDFVGAGVVASRTGNKITITVSGNANFRGTYVSLVALQAAIPNGNAGDYADVDVGVGTDVQRYIWDVDDAQWVLGGGGAITGAAVVAALGYTPKNIIGFNAVGANTKSGTPVPAITSYILHQHFIFRNLTANTGAVTLNLNGVGAVSVVKNGNQALVSGDLTANTYYLINYDGTNFQIVGRFLTDGNGTTANGTAVDLGGNTTGNINITDNDGSHDFDIGNGDGFNSHPFANLNFFASTFNFNGEQIATQAYADALVVGLLDDRGNYNASVNTFPASGGSGTAGAILKGDLWTISVAGTLGGVAVTAGDVLRALVDTPGQTASNWVITENNIGYVPQQQNTALTQISGLSPSDDDIIQRKSGAWTNRTLAQYKADLAQITNLPFLEGAATYTNQPNTEQFLAGIDTHRVQFDATGYQYVRVVGYVRVTSASANSPRAYPQYSLTGAGAPSWITIGTGTGSDSMTMATGNNQSSAWIALPAGAKADVFFRIAVNGGDGAADPQVASVMLQFKN